MVKFELKDNTVIIKIDTGIGFTVSTQIVRNGDLDAKLLYNQLNKQQWETIERHSKKMYEQGYSDKTKKKPKQTWFPTNINS